MSGSHTADLFFLLKCLAELFGADIITDYAGRKRQASSEIYSLTFATEIMMEVLGPWDSNESQTWSFASANNVKKIKLQCWQCCMTFREEKNIYSRQRVNGVLPWPFAQPTLFAA